MLDENAYYLKKYSTLQQGTHKIGFKCYCNVSMHFCIIIIKFRTNFKKYIWSKVLSSYIDAFLILSKTTSPQKLFSCELQLIIIFLTVIVQAGWGSDGQPWLGDLPQPRGLPHLPQGVGQRQAAPQVRHLVGWVHYLMISLEIC